jgi:ribosomal protein S18 acetylase RimI-like enzyme
MVKVRTARPEDLATVVDTAARSLDAEAIGDNAEHWAAFWGWVGEHEPPEPLLYLSHIGVVPERQGQGLGTALMLDGLTAQGQGVPAWLETSRADNVAYYERFGFRTVEDADAPDRGPHIWFMRRDPA